MFEVSNIQLLDGFVPNEQDLSEEAKQLFPYHTKIFDTFQFHQTAALRNTHMTPIGRQLYFSDAAELLRRCRSVLNYIAMNKNILQSSCIDRPLIIIGLPRTGSTLLYNLLDCDSNARAPYITDMLVKCIPPIPRSDSTGVQERLLELKSISEQREHIVGRKYRMTASHPSFLIDEDYFILRHAGFSMLFFIHGFDGPCESEKWLFDEHDKEFLYDYHEIFLRMLNSVDTPRSHWLFKGPFHALFLDNFLQHYSQARLIMTHRRLEDIIPSFCQLLWIAMNIYYDENDVAARNAVTEFATRFIDKMVERLMRFRTYSSYATSNNIFDVAYDDLMERPIAIVRNIYEHFGLDYSDEFEEAMKKWLHDNPQGKQGRNTYHLADVNLTVEDIEKRYANYIDRFLAKKEINVPKQSSRKCI